MREKLIYFTRSQIIARGNKRDSSFALHIVRICACVLLPHSVLELQEIVLRLEAILRLLR